MAPAAAADGVAGAAVDGAAATVAGADAAAVAIDAAAAVAAAWNLICKWPSSWSGYPVGRHF